MLGLPLVFNRALIEAPYTERRPEWSAYLQDDFRASDRLTLNLGVRWDLFVPYVEDDDRQANFDTSSGRFVVASPDATIAGVRVGRHLQTYSKTDFAPRLGFAYDLRGSGRTMLRGGFGMFWNTPLTGTGSSKAQNPPFLLSQALQSPLPFVPVLSYSSASVQPTPQTGGNSRSSFDPNFRDGYAQQWSVNVQQQLGTNYMVEVGYVGSRGRQLVTLVDVNQAPAQIGVTNSNINRPFFGVNPALGSVTQSQSRGTLDYHALLTRVVRRFSNGVSFTSSYTFGKAIDLSSDTDGISTFPNCVRPRLQPRALQLRRDARVDVDLDVYAAVPTRGAIRRMADQRPAAGSFRLPVHGISEPESAVHADRGHPGPALSSKSDWIGTGGQSDGRSMVRHDRVRPHQRADRRVWERRAQHPARPRAVHDRRRAREADHDWQTRDRDPPRGIQPAQSSGLRQPREHDRRVERGHDLEPDALHPDATAADRSQGQVLTRPGGLAPPAALSAVVRGDPSGLIRSRLRQGYGVARRSAFGAKAAGGRACGALSRYAARRNECRILVSSRIMG